MLRRFLLAIMIIGCLPALASATWYVTASTSPSSGGTITNPGSASYPDTTLSVNYTVTPKSGYVINMVRVNGVAINAISPGVYRINKSAGQQYLVAYMAVKTYSVTTSVTAGGSILQTFQNPINALPGGGTYTFNISPNTGYMVSDVIVDGVSYGPMTSYTFANLDADHTILVSFAVAPRVVATASPYSSQTTGLGPGYGMKLDGSRSTTALGTLSYLWSVTSTSPAGLTGGAFSDPTAASPIFYADKPGVYNVTLTCSDGQGHYASSSVTVEAVTRQAYLSLYCLSCHASRSAKTTANYKMSPHYITTKAIPSCQFCHLPGLPDTDHYSTQRPNDACKNCHTSFPPNTPGHIDEVGANNCVGCHDPHSTLPTAFYGAPPHFNSITSGSYPASYVSSRQVCSNCHSPNNDSMRAEENRQAWAKSGHGATKGNGWTVKDFKTLDGCVRCHTTTGFLAYSSGKVTKAWGVASDKTKEILGCNSCHFQDFALRNFKPYSSASAYSFRVDAATVVSVPYKNSDYAASNVCLRCHAGTTSGEVIKRAFAFASFTAGGRLVNHFMAGGGVMDNNIGYEFDGTPRGRELDFNKGNTWHAGIGSPASKVDTGTSGACVVCHMGAPGEEHGFAAAFSNLSTVVSLPAQTVCDKCHPSQLGGGPRMSVSGMNGYKRGLAAALAALKAQLTVKGLNPDGAVASWGATAAERSNNMGAYYNYLLLKKSDPAAYIHNSIYAKRLIQYSLDWLDNGLFDDSAAFGIHALPGLTLDAKKDAVSYLGLDDSSTANCVNCHQAYYNN